MTDSLAGWRVGFAVGNPEMIHALKRIKSYLDYGMPQAIQIGAIAALRGPQDCVEENCAVYKERRDVLIEGIDRGSLRVEPDAEVKPPTLFIEIDRNDLENFEFIE